jgi:protein phosphatase
MSAGAFEIEVHAITDVGCARTRNEDAVVVMDAVMQVTSSARLSALVDGVDLAVIAVVDGMGGHAHGDYAGSLVARAIAERRREFLDETHIADSIREINRDLHSASMQAPELSGMGATLAGIAVVDASVFIFSIGDAAVFDVTSHYALQRSVSDAVGPAQPGAVTQSLGGATTELSIDPHILREALDSEKTYLICSDGLTAALSLAAIEDAMAESASFDERVQALVTAALEAGAPDNVSVVLAKVIPRPSAAG